MHVVTQLVMAAVPIAAAATLGEQKFDTVEEIAAAIVVTLTAGRTLAGG